MKNKYELLSGAQFDEASDIAIKLKVLAGEIYNAQTELEWFKRQMFAETATGSCLDLIAAQRGLERKSATKAKGKILFVLAEALDYDIQIPKGSCAAVAGETPVRFVTIEEGVIVAGSISARINAEAAEAGSIGNASAHTVNVPVNVPSEILRVSNTSAFMDGCDDETDDELRERIRSTYIKLPNGTNAAYYEQLALTVDGVAKAGAVGRYRGDGTVDVFISGNGTKASSQMVSKVQLLLNEKRELNVDVKVSAANMVTYDLDVVLYKKNEFTDEEVKAKCLEAFKDYINSIGIGGRVYLSGLGRYLLNTGCLENYEFNSTMDDMSLSKSQCFTAGSAVMVVS